MTRKTYYTILPGTAQAERFPPTYDPHELRLVASRLGLVSNEDGMRAPNGEWAKLPTWRCPVTGAKVNIGDWVLFDASGHPCIALSDREFKANYRESGT